MQTVSQKSFLYILTGTTLFAFLLRFFFCVSMIDVATVYAPTTGTDMATYFRLANDILQCGHFPEIFYYQPFYYSVFLPLCLFIGSGTVWGVFIMQSLLGAATVWLTGLTAAQFFGRRAGLYAALILALARFHILYTPFMLIAVLQSFWMILIAYFVLRAYRKNTSLLWSITAIICGFACLTRGNILLLFPGVILLFIYKNFSSKLKLTLGTSLLLLFFYLPQLPFSLHNYNALKRWTGPSSAQDAVLAIGNNPESAAGGLGYSKTYQIWLKQADSQNPNRIPVAKQMWKWFSKNPAAYLELKWRMLLLFWDSREIPNNISIDSEGKDSVLIHMPFLIDFGVIAVLAIAGFLATFSYRSTRKLFLYFLIIIYCMSIVLFYILARFRLPIVPLLAIFSGAYIQQITLWCKHYKQQKNLLLHLLYICVAIFVVYYSYNFYQLYIEKYIVNIIRSNGVQINDKNFYLTYDHGPKSMGGWRYLPLNTETVFKKDFIFKPGCDIEKMHFSLIIPVTAEKGSMLEIKVYEDKQLTKLNNNLHNRTPTGGIKYFTVKKRYIDAEPVVIKIPTPAPEKDTISYIISLKPLKGDFFISYDTARNYGRSIMLSGNIKDLPKKTELCFGIMGQQEGLDID